MPPSLLGLTCAQWSSLGRRLFIEARGEAKGSGVAAKLYRNFFRTGSLGPETAGLSPASRTLWESVAGEVRPLGLEHLADDEHGAAKAVFGLADGSRIETVLVPMGAGRATLCVSSQVGCAMGCAFCETGRVGLRRNLDATEIVAQVHTARFGLGWDFSSLVFMGMGEPLDNLDALVQALKVLLDPAGVAFAQERITVCTAGLSAGIEALAAQGWKRMGLSLSLNSATNQKRERLMPVTRSNPLEALQTALAAYPMRPNFVLALNYCLLPGINDAEQDARDIAAFAQGLGRTLVNLIPYNPGTRPLTRAPTEAEVDAFLGYLKGADLEAKVRGPKGRSIRAACGQLGASKVPAILDS